MEKTFKPYGVYYLLPKVGWTGIEFYSKETACDAYKRWALHKPVRFYEFSGSGKAELVDERGA